MVMVTNREKDERVSKEAGYWLELKEAWRRLTPESKRLDLSVETLGYFQALAFRYFTKVLGADRPLARLRLSTPAAQEVWDIMFRELHVRRTRTGERLFDDLFLRAFESARALGCGDSAEDLLGFLKKQFELRLRDVARSWAREQVGTLGGRPAESLDEMAKGAADEGHKGHEVTPARGSEQDDPEWRDLQRCGWQVADVMFAGMDSLGRNCVLLHSLHVSLAHPLVVASLGKGKSVLFDHERKLREEVVARCRTADPVLDPQGLMALAVAAYQHLREQCEEWFSSEMRTSPIFQVVMERISQVTTPQQASIS